MTHDATSLWSSDLAAPGRAAQLLLASIGLAVMPLFLLTYPSPTHKVMLLGNEALPRDARSFHRLALARDGTIGWDGKTIGLVELRTCLDLLSIQPGDGVDFRPDPDARYDVFLEVLAVIRRAAVQHLRLDNRPFRAAIEGASAAAPTGMHPARVGPAIQASYPVSLPTPPSIRLPAACDDHTHGRPARAPAAGAGRLHDQI